MSVPSTIYAGDQVEWEDKDVPADATAVSVWFRTNTAGAGVEATGTLDNDTWTVTLSAAQTGPMVAGSWSYQAIATVDGAPRTYDSGRVEVVASFAYTGTPDAVDTRTQAEKDLEAVDEAIRVLQSGAQSYTIGTATGGRTFSRPQLKQLTAWRDRLLIKVASERAANGSSGRKDRRILVSFES